MPFRKAPGLFDSDSAAPASAFLTAHVDGGARGNPGPAGFGAAIDDASGKRIAELSEFLGPQTNNFAEYSGLIAALEYTLENGYRSLKVVSDSELLVKQIKRQYKVRSESLLDIYRHARQLIGKLDHFEIRHVLRHLNKDADRLANEAMDRGMKGIRTDRANAYAKPPAIPQSATVETKLEPKVVRGFVTGGVVEFVGERLPNGIYVTIKPEGS
jgi:probable phosphoglycerate mutase